MRIRRHVALPMLFALAGCDGAHSVLRDAPGDTLLAVNGTRLWVHVEAGDGAQAGSPETAMVVVHGGPLLDHGYLVEPLRPLTDLAPLVFYDQRLSGRSDGVGQADDGVPIVSLDLLVDDIEALRAELGLDRIHLLGHSWGSGLAVRYAIAHPDRLGSLVLVSPPAPAFDLAEREGRVQTASLEPADTAGLGALRASPGMAAREPETIEQMLRISFRGQLVDRALAEDLEFEIPDDYAARSRALGAVGPELAGYDLTSELRTLRVPTLVIYGAAETGATVSGPAWEALLPDGRVTSIDGAKHFAFLERPEAFQRVVRGFLERR
jgi:proline iminopeptidase